MMTPYFSQWESMELAPAIIAGTFDLINDPRWENSGAKSREEYAAWANHICGMACLKMILSAKFAKVYPIMELTRMAVEYGAYTVDGDKIKGMIYAPFVALVADKFGLAASIMTGLPAGDLYRHLKQGRFFIASVHPSIRRLASAPPAKGGHLVLVTAATQNNLVFHNPSGDRQSSRENVGLSVEKFSLYYAERGILI